jgi:hypothetical protein
LAPGPRVVSAARPWVCWLVALVACPFALAWLLAADAPLPSPVRPIVLPGEPESIVVVFVDSLSDRVARDPKVMPNLTALAGRGAALEVEPCRDRLTYLCLRAALTGRDESSLLALHRNFDHDLPSGDTLLHAVSRTGGRVVAAGAHDLAPYRAALEAYAPFPTAESPEREAIASWKELIAKRPARVALLGFSEGDRAAHAHGARSLEHAAAFGRIDAAIGEIVASLPPSTHLLVLGDHGHDERGRHLPGGEATTYAVYVGPAFRAGVKEHASITDHRAILGVLLGVSTPATYTGPPLERLFEPAWVAERFAGGLPPLRGRAAPALSVAKRAMLAGAVALLACMGLAAAAERLSRRLGLASAAPRALAVAAGLVALLALEGHGYQGVRAVIHDHGATPERSLFLLIPLGIGFAAALGVERAWPHATSLRGRASWVLLAGGPVSVLATMLCLFPSANYYGAGRAVVYASLLAIAAALAGAWLASGPAGGAAARSAWPRGPGAWLGIGCATAALALFYDVSGQGGARGEMMHYVMRAGVFQGSAWPPLVVAKAALFALLCSALAPSRVDRALGAGLLGLCLLTQLGGLTLARPATLALLAACAAASTHAGRRLPLAQTCAAVLLLGVFFPAQPVHTAPIEVLLAGTVGALIALGRAPLRSPTRSLARGITLVVAWYLMLWPTVGMRLSGLDFAFMFGWVPVARTDELWWVIALGMAAKFAWPYWLLGRIASHAGVGAAEHEVLRSGLAAKALCLALFASAYAVTHPLSSNLAQEILAELVLVAALTLLAGVSLPGAAIWLARLIAPREGRQQITVPAAGGFPALRPASHRARTAPAGAGSSTAPRRAWFRPEAATSPGARTRGGAPTGASRTDLDGARVERSPRGGGQ